MKTSAAGIAMIQKFETCALKAYLCPAGVWTIGWGHTGPDVKPGMVITQARANELLAKDVERFERDVLALVKVPISQGQFDALVSFSFNVGSDIDADDVAEGLGDSTLLRKLNAGDVIGASDEFPKWCKARGTILMGLVKRRAAERELFLEGVA